MGSVLSKLCLATAAATCLLVPPGIHALARSSRSSPTELMKAVMHLEDDIARILKKHSRHHGFLAAEEEGTACEALHNTYFLIDSSKGTEGMFAEYFGKGPDDPDLLAAKAAWKACEDEVMQAYLCKKRPPLDPADVARFDAMAKAEGIRHDAEIAAVKAKAEAKLEASGVSPGKKFMDDAKLAALQKIHNKALQVLSSALLDNQVQKEMKENAEDIYTFVGALENAADFTALDVHKAYEKALADFMKSKIEKLKTAAGNAKKKLDDATDDATPETGKDVTDDVIAAAVQYEKLTTATDRLEGLLPAPNIAYQTIEAALRAAVPTYEAAMGGAGSPNPAAYETVEAALAAGSPATLYQTLEDAVTEAVDTIVTDKDAKDAKDAKKIEDGAVSNVVDDLFEIEGGECTEVIASGPLIQKIFPAESPAKKKVWFKWKNPFKSK